MLENPEVIREILRRLRELNLEQPPKYHLGKQYYSQHRGQIIGMAKDWDAKHSERAKQRREKYEASEHGRATSSIRRHKNRALRLGSQGYHTTQEWLDKWVLILTGLRGIC